MKLLLATLVLFAGCHTTTPGKLHPFSPSDIPTRVQKVTPKSPTTKAEAPRKKEPIWAFLLLIRLQLK